MKPSETVKGKVELSTDSTGIKQIPFVLKEIKKVGKGKYKIVKRVKK